MAGMNERLSNASEYMGQPLSIEEFAGLNLPSNAMNRLANLLQDEAEGRELSPIDRAQLIAFKEAALYMRLKNFAA